MKKAILLFVIGLALGNGMVAQKIGVEKATLVAKTWIKSQANNQDLLIANFKPIINDDTLLAYSFNIEPCGFIVISSNKSIAPIIAYSFETDFIINEDNPLLLLLTKDLSNRIDNINIMPDEVLQENNSNWDQLLGTEIKYPAFEQWPPAGSTATDGWVETQWSQSAPYNNDCPMDLVSGSRSVAGCPSIAISMIINYTNTINGTRLGNDDKYYHNYGGNNYWIDDDYMEYDFASFDDINDNFDSIEYLYDNNSTLSTDQISALVFGCGVAARQVYASGGSGTFGVNQAFDAFERFGFDNANLVYDSDTNFYTHMQDNIKNAMPVLLALLVANGPGGHNVVADGYNTNDFYHLNFGWGGSYNSWYNIPEGIPYNLTIVEGAVMDIGTKIVSIEPISDPLSTFSLSPNPSKGPVNIDFTISKNSKVELYVIDNNGLKIRDVYNGVLDSGKHTFTFTENVSTGLYHVVLVADTDMTSKPIIIF